MVDLERVNPRHRVAYHEAGHAVVATALGLTCLLAELRGGYSGTTYNMPERSPNLRKEAIVTMAGSVAERRFLGCSDGEIWMLTGSSSDHDRVLDEVGRLTGRKDPGHIESGREWKQAWSWAQIHVTRWWPVIVKVAELLIRDEEVAGETVRELIDAHRAGMQETTRAAVA
jgi:hypothetical protein